MKITRNLLYKMIMEAMETEFASLDESGYKRLEQWHDDKKFEQWLEEEFLKGVKYYKRGDEGFDHDTFEDVIKTFLSIEWNPESKRPWREGAIHPSFAAYRFKKKPDDMFPFIWDLLETEKHPSWGKTRRKGKKSFYWDSDMGYYIVNSDENPRIKYLQNFAKKLLGGLSFSGRHLPTFKKAGKALGLKEQVASLQQIINKKGKKK